MSTEFEAARDILFSYSQDNSASENLAEGIIVILSIPYKVVDVSLDCLLGWDAILKRKCSTIEL